MNSGPISHVLWLDQLLTHTGSGGYSSAARTFRQCPAHPDPVPSLTLANGEHGALLMCRAGCPTEVVLARLGLALRHLFTPPPMSPAAWTRFANLRLSYPPMTLPRGGHDPSEHLEAVHDFGEWFRLERWRSTSGKKRLAWFRRDEAGAWIPGLGGHPTSELPLYREDDIPKAAAVDDPLFVVESESSVDALNRHGHYAITWAGSAVNPPLAKLARLLAGVSDVRVIADHDPGGSGIACALNILAVVHHATGWLPARPGDDARDVLPELAALLPLPRNDESAPKADPDETEEPSQ
jgi:hypothetical protein